MQEKNYLKMDVELINQLIDVIGSSTIITPFRFNTIMEQIKKSEPIQPENKQPKDNE